MRGVLDLYQKQNRWSLPGRIVVHKTSRYWDEELAGFEDACQSVPRRDFVALGSRGIQFYRPGEYPALRGTYVKFGAENILLYTVGYIPFLRTYPGARVPHPLEVLEHHGDSSWNVVLQEILALTKTNWNTADFACSEPVTIAFSHRVGQILAELPTHSPGQGGISILYVRAGFRARVSLRKAGLVLMIPLQMLPLGFARNVHLSASFVLIRPIP